MTEPDHQSLQGSTIRLSAIDAIASTLGPDLPDLGQLSSPDGAVTLLLADVDEAAALQESLGIDRWEAVLRDHEVLVRQLVAHHDGQIFKAHRDGFLASFPSAHAGLHCAVELQRTTWSGAVSDEPAVRLRAGLHSGFVIANPEELLGRNVVLAARIAGQAKGGEILVSSTLKQYTERDPSFRFEERGEFHFRGLHGQHTVFAVLWKQD
ncbi:MAG: adenylate/guanylate cyclase domain-containing protein [Solirubrobacteraceae bacterium]